VFTVALIPRRKKEEQEEEWDEQVRLL